MREIRLQGQADFIHRNRAAKINRQRGIRIAVDAPVLVRPAAVGVILVNVFHRVAGGNGCEEDGLEPYVEDVLDTFLQAITTRKVKNLPQYMKSLLWTSFATYKLNTISGITAPYKEVKNVYGLH